jgi:parallel beta-helix repeat protein
MKRYALFAAVIMFVSLFIVSGASAVIRCVKTTPVLGCPSYATIQAAVNAALPADTIVVHPGVYYENVYINGNAPDNKFNITIQGGKVVFSLGRLTIQATTPEQAVVDARPVFDTCTGPGFNIDMANNISIKNLTVRHACYDGFSGDNIYSTGSYTVIDKVYSLNSDEDGVDVDGPGDHATVQNSVFFGNDGDGVDVTGYAIVQNNSIWNNYYDGVYVDGPNSTVTRNDIKTSDSDDCIHLCYNSDGARVTYNTIQSCTYDGIASHNSSNQDISNNTIKSVYYGGIYIYGDDVDGIANNITIRNNTINGVGRHGIILANYVSNSLIDMNNISSTHYEGIYVDTMPDSFVAANIVSNNSVQNVHQGEGINVSDRMPTLTTNTVQNVFEEDCFQVNCGSSDCDGTGQITNNKAFYCGENDDGFNLDVWNILISGNIAEHIHDKGFKIDGDNNTIQNNTARWCGTNSDSGFGIDGDNNNINGNLAEFNSLRGFEIYGNNTITRNTARKNYQTGMRLGYADGGTVNVTYNTVTDNQGEGIANFAPDGGSSFVIISNNTVLRNRTDICNEGTIDIFSSNIFTTGGTGTPCDLE